MRPELVGHALALGLHALVDLRQHLVGELDAAQPYVDDLYPDGPRIGIRFLPRFVHDLVTLGGDRLVDRALVDLLGEIGADRLRETALRGFLVVPDALIVLAHVDDAPVGDEIDPQRLFFRGGDPIGLWRVERQYAAIVELDVLQQRYLEVEPRFSLGVDEFAELELDRELLLVNGIERLRQHEKDCDNQRDDGDRGFHRASPRSRLRGNSRLRLGSSVTVASGAAAVARGSTAAVAPPLAACVCLSSWSRGR